MMKDKTEIRIFWPTQIPPDIFETRYSYYFCRKISFENCLPILQTANDWIDYEGIENLTYELETNSKDYNIVITEPEIIVSRHSCEGLIRTIDRGFDVSGPVFNDTSISEQRASLPFPYSNYSTFMEIEKKYVSRTTSESRKVNTLDPGCFLLKKKAVPLLPNLLAQKPFPAGFAVGVAPGALVHRFSDYYATERKDLVDLIPPDVKTVLDVGCAMGGYGKSLKQYRPEIYLIGVEPNGYMADLARPFYDEIIQRYIEDVDLAYAVDAINCGDVLEHLYNPCKTVRKLHSNLKEGGHLIFSVPNIGHWSITRDLLKGKFQYIPVGLQCVTHIRWFTEESIREMLEETGFQIEVLHQEKIPPTPEGEKFISDICSKGYGDRDSLETAEYTIRAVKI